MLHCYEAAVACATAWLAIHKSAVNPFLTESERMIRLIPDRQQDRRIRLITIRRCRYLRNGRRKTSPSQLISSHNHHPHPKQPVSSSSISRNPIPDHTQTANSPRYASQPNQQNPHKNALSTQAQPSTSSRPHAQNAQTHPPPKSSCLYSPAHQCNCGLKPGSRRRRTRERGVGNCVEKRRDSVSSVSYGLGEGLPWGEGVLVLCDLLCGKEGWGEGAILLTSASL